MTVEYEMMTVEYEMMTVEYGMRVEYEPYSTVSSSYSTVMNDIPLSLQWKLVKWVVLWFNIIPMHILCIVGSI